MYTKVSWTQREKWCCNRCIRIFYSIVRTLYVGFWFYYIPFLALTVNFSIPFLAEKLGGFVDETEAGTMSTEYADFVAQTLGEVETNFDEPSVPDLLKMMDDTPLQGDDWKQNPETLVVPLSLD